MSMTRKQRGRSSASLMPLVVLALAVVLGCGDRCSEPPPPTGVQGAHALAEVVPADAKAVAFAENLGELVERIDRVNEVFPGEIDGPGETSDWQRMGANVDGPAAAFWDGEQWVLVGWVEPERDVELDAWTAEGSVEERDVGEDEESRGRLWSDEQGHWTQWVTTDGRRIAAGWSLDEGARALDESLWHLGDGEHWEIDARHRRFEGGDGDGDASSTPEARVYGAIDGERLLRQLEGEGYAAVLLYGLAKDLGTVYWTVDRADEERWTVALETPGGGVGAGEDLGEAREQLPGLGGLLRRGSPGVVRLSAQPERVVELFRSNLDAPERAQFDMALEMLREQLSVDLEEDAIANVTGQLAVVVLGFEDDFFEAEGMERLAALFRLDATRGAMVVPFEDREAMKAVLDAFTQLTRGQLQRQETERAIEYARLDDGALKWAAILGDDHLVIVDSAVAFDHVRSWERSPGPLDDVFAQRGVDSMLEAKRGMGVYIDVATVRSLVREGGDDELATWLSPVEALRIVTDVDGQRERTEVDIWPSRRVGAGEE